MYNREKQPHASYEVGFANQVREIKPENQAAAQAHRQDYHDFLVKAHGLIFQVKHFLNPRLCTSAPSIAPILEVRQVSEFHLMH